jgi:hypothetical protein
LIRPGTDRERIAGSKKCLGEGAALAREPGNSGGNRNVILSEGFTFRNFLVDVFAIFMFVLWFWVLIGIISDLFRRHDISGWGKAIWKGVIVLVSAYHSRRSHQMTIGSTIRNSPVSVLYGLMIVSLIALLPFPPLLQNQSYHEFADQRELFGIPNFWNVVSNLPFIAVGGVGLLRLRRDSTTVVLFSGIFLTGFGSSYYHLNPNDNTLFWDRLPMTFCFAAILAAVVEERVDSRAGAMLLRPLLAIGVFSLLLWRWTDVIAHRLRDCSRAGVRGVSRGPISKIDESLKGRICWF